MRHSMMIITFALAICSDARAMRSSDDSLFGVPGEMVPVPRLELDEEIQLDLWQTVNNSLIPFEQRLAAERRLRAARDVRMLKVAFAGLVEPVEIIRVLDHNADAHSPVERIAMPFATGSIKAEWDADAPVSVQIANARGRIWSSLAHGAEPESERHRIYSDLFDQAQSPYHLRRLITTASRQNWTPKVRKHLLSIYQNADLSAGIRSDAGNTLLDMHHKTPRIEFLETRKSIIDAAWKERHTPFAHLLGERLGARDPRAALLRLDWYDQRLEQARKEGRLPMKGMVDAIDAVFENISGLYRNPRAALTHKEIERRDRRFEFMQEARETDDDTKLREFEAELAAKQQAELEERIEKIDAWIAANRERLEAEAEAYAREREILRRPPADE